MRKHYGPPFEIDLRRAHGASYDELYNNFEWNIPEYFNLAEALCDRHSTSGGDRVAIHHYRQADSLERKVTFNELRRSSSQLANVLSELGVKRGDRIGIMLYQGPEMATALLAAYRLGAIHVTMSVLSGPDSVAYKIRDCQPSVFIVDSRLRSKITEPTSVGQVISVGGAVPGEIDYKDIESASPNCENARTRCDDPAMIFYSSGTTGQPKGIVHSHRMMLGLVPCWQLSYGLAPRSGDVYWGPGEWAWLGGLGNLVYPAWYFGMPVVAFEKGEKFDPMQAFSLIQAARVTACYFVPTALRIMKQAVHQPRTAYRLSSLRVIVSGSERVGADLYEWCNEALGVPLNELYGLTEATLVLGNCSGLMSSKPGSMGKQIPGHVVDIIDEKGDVLRPGEVGEIAIRRDSDPVMFLGYWKKEGETAARFVKDWFKTGDLGYKDEEGYFWFLGRNDDLIKTSAYRIGPSEIEEALCLHPAVLECGVIGKPDARRNTIVKAYVVLKDGFEPSDALVDDIKGSIRSRVASYAYPREIEFIERLPKTSTGKLQRYVLRAMSESQQAGA